MIEAVVYAICLFGLGMQLWFGVAVVGVPPNHEVVFREKSPMKYWCMILIELLIGSIIGWFRIRAGMN